MDSLDQLKNQVFGKQKILADVYTQNQGESLFDYASNWQLSGASGGSQILAKTAQELLTQNYPEEIAKGVATQLASQPLVSTIDHHGILNHPFFINSNLIFGLKKELKYLVCLSTSGISLNNSSWPGCFLLTGKSGDLKRFSFFTDSGKTQSVFSAPATGKINVAKVLRQISADGDILPGQKIALEKLLAEIFAAPEINNQENFSAQASLISSLLWSKIFPSAPKIIYLPVEDLASRIITKEIVPNPRHILHRLLFTEKGRELAEKYFSGQPGAFAPNSKGSFLFWGAGQKGRRVALGSAGFNLSAEDITAGLLHRNLYPTSLVCFLVLLHYGITCLGGFNQVNWLTDIKEIFLVLSAEIGGSADDIERIKNTPTQNFAEGNLAFLPKNGGLVKATGIDLYLSGSDYYSTYQNLARSISLGQSIESLLPEIYRVITPAQQRKAELLALDDLAIASQNGMEQKIKAVFI